MMLRLNVPVPSPVAAVDYGAALRAMVDKGYLHGAGHMANRWKAYRVGAHSDVVEFEHRLCLRFKRLGVPLYGSEVMRSPERQTELYIRGLSEHREWESPHQYGLAVDIVHGSRRRNLDPKSWEVIGHIGAEVALQNGLAMEWAGLKNPAHWQLNDWPSLRAGYPFGLK